MRTYAMWNRNKFVLAILVALGSGCVIVDFVSLGHNLLKKDQSNELWRSSISKG